MGTNIAYDGGLTAWVGTRDLDRAITWYQDVLGFELRYKMDELEPQIAHATLTTAGTQLGAGQLAWVRARV